MLKNITDIENWKTDYPFLEEVWKTYKKFDNTTDVGSSVYDVTCSDYILKKIDEESIKYKGFCIKLMKNLRYYSTDGENYNLTKERCNILFNWMYKLMNEQNIKTNVINKIFERYDDDMNSVGNKNKCYFYPDIIIHEPINITLLDIFDDKMPAIETALTDIDISNSARGVKYVCECAKIYRYMNDKYCLNGKADIKENSSTCSRLKDFRDSYMWVLYSKDYLSPIIPSLDNIDQDLLLKCSEKEKRLQLDSDARAPQGSYTEHSSTEEVEGAKPYLEMDTTLGNADNQMRKTITTTIGTVAGASSLLAFLYKIRKSQIKKNYRYDQQ
ncbi:hypothetical protein PVIIG_05213 [Plasmodium vivax India VII]|uniref:Uncharacterized protein n=1 Tax=Plasmodium vivax India VII TaxID=1077284 RepID=A0A0J9S3C2_PLAVI|nr:hypothetical protein PVIIG_05213 [Plasmodium vivax India VII]